MTLIMLTGPLKSRPTIPTKAKAIMMLTDLNIDCLHILRRHLAQIYYLLIIRCAIAGQALILYVNIHSVIRAFYICRFILQYPIIPGGSAKALIRLHTHVQSDLGLRSSTMPPEKWTLVQGMKFCQNCSIYPLKKGFTPVRKELLPMAKT